MHDKANQTGTPRALLWLPLLAALGIPMNSVATRALSVEEYELSHWLLHQGGTEAQGFVGQLENAEAVVWKCDCGCASFHFKVKNLPEAAPGVHILSEFTFGDASNLASVFIYSSNGILSGVEVSGLGIDAPAKLPKIGELRPWSQENA